MKSFLLLIVMCFGFVLVQAQQINSSSFADSNQAIILREITLVTSKAGNQQQLIHFYRSNHAASLEDIMSKIPQLTLTRRGSYGMEPSIRSFSGSQINLLLDGMRIHGACTDKMDPASIYIEPVNLDKLTIQTGTNGFLNGSSIGGSINLKLAEPELNKLQVISGSFSSGYQTAAQSWYESARILISKNNWALLGSGTYRKAANYRSGGGVTVPFSQYEKINISLSGKYRINESTSFKVDFLADNGYNIGYPALPMDVGKATARIASISIKKEDPISQFTLWEAKIYGNSIVHNMDDTHRPNVPMHMDMPGISKTQGAYFHKTIRFNKQHELQLKTDLATTYLKASMTMYQDGQLPMYMLTWPDNRKNQSGISAAWILVLDSINKLTFQGRADWINYRLVTDEAKNQMSILNSTQSNRDDLLKNISFQYSKSLHTNWKWTTGISYSENMPSASQLYGFYLFNAQDGYDYIGNPELNKEQSLQADLSIQVTKKKFQLQLNAYYAHVYNYILGKNTVLSSMTIGAYGVKQYYNLLFAKLLGAEFAAMIKPGRYIQWVSTIRYSKGMDAEKNHLPNIAALKQLHTIRFQKKLYSFQFESESALAQHAYSETAGEDYTPGYSLFHIRGTYRLNFNKLFFDIQAGLENIFDIEYHEHLDWGNIPRPGRNGYLQLTMHF